MSTQERVLNIQILDAEFLDFHVNKSTVGFYFHLGKKLLDVLVLSDQCRLQVPIKKGSVDKLVLVAKNLGEDEERHGSVTFLLENYFGTGSDIQLGKSYVQWITLFDHPDDDIYDGVLTESDEEVPRIQFEFIVEEIGDVNGRRDRASDISQKQGVKDKSPANARREAQTITQKVSTNLKEKTNQARTGSGRPGSTKGVPTGNGATVGRASAHGRNEVNQISRSGNIGAAANATSSSINQQPPLSKADFKREKDFQLQQIQTEIKKYDLEEMKTDVAYKVAIVVNNLKKSERMLVADENRNIRQLEKVEHMQKTLAEDSQNVKDSLEQTDRLKTRAQANFEAIEKENQDEKKKYEQQLKQLEETLLKLQTDLTQSKNNNQQLKQQVQTTRRADQDYLQQRGGQQQANTNPETAAIEKSIKDNRTKVQQIDLDAKQEYALKDRAIQKFNDQENQFSKTIQSNDRTLKDADRERQTLQDKQNTMESEFDQATAENLRLKSLTFDLDFKLNHYQILVDQSQKKLKFFQDKQSKLTKDLDQATVHQEKELRRLQQELELSKKDLEKLRRESLLKLEELRRLESGNAHIQAEKYELQIEQMEIQLREAEAIRKQLQYQLEYAGAQWECKLRLFIKDHDDRARQSDDQLKRIRQLMEDLRLKSAQESNFHQQREKLVKNQHENVERNELIEAYKKECEDYDKLIRDVQRQKQDIEAEIDQINQALQQRLQKMNEQLNLLDVIRREKNDYKKELERLHYKVKDLNKHIEKYRAEIARLEEERELLNERVQELEALVGKRDEEIQDMEGMLADKERIIAQLEAKLKSLNQTPVEKKPVYQLPKGDLLDEMLGQYIHQANCPVPIKKLGNGYYIFGTRKIYAKILNGKLVIRVGGGYMIIEEFISTYAEQELKKMNKLEEKTDEADDDVDSLDLTPASRGGSRRAASGKGINARSPRSGMPTNEKTFAAAVDYGLSGTHRQKKLTQKAIERIQKDPRAGRVLEQMEYQQ